MARAEIHRITFKDFAANLTGVFDEIAADNEQILIEKEGKTYRLEHVGADGPSDIWANYDPEKVIRALKASAGALDGVDTEHLKADIRAARGDHRRPRPKL